jgi:hypothetical protein
MVGHTASALSATRQKLDQAVRDRADQARKSAAWPLRPADRKSFDVLLPERGKEAERPPASGQPA